jgi:hypothetical protein
LKVALELPFFLRSTAVSTLSWWLRAAQRAARPGPAAAAWRWAIQARNQS